MAVLLQLHSHLWNQFDSVHIQIQIIELTEWNIYVAEFIPTLGSVRSRVISASFPWISLVRCWIWTFLTSTSACIQSQCERSYYSDECLIPSQYKTDIQLKHTVRIFILLQSLYMSKCLKDCNVLTLNVCSSLCNLLFSLALSRRSLPCLSSWVTLALTSTCSLTLSS